LEELLVAILVTLSVNLQDRRGKLLAGAPEETCFQGPASE
jgi:hypothetical protein